MTSFKVKIPIDIYVAIAKRLPPEHGVDETILGLIQHFLTGPPPPPTHWHDAGEPLESDVQKWLDAKTTEERGARVSLAEAHACFSSWMLKEGYGFYSRPLFTRRLTAAGVKHGTASLNGVTVRCMFNTRVAL